VQDYKELMELATKGDESRVSTLCRDLRSGSGEKDYYDFMPEDIVVFPFGKVADIKVEG
jgi:pantothenate kinase